MAYLAPIHYATSIRHALKINFLSSEEESLIAAKNNRLEIYSQTQNGLVSQYTRAMYGKITMLSKLRPASSSADHLFVGIDRSMYFTLSWDAATKQLRTEKTYVDQADKSARDSQTGDRVHIDPTGSFMTLEIYEGIITIVPIIGPSTLPKRSASNQATPEHGTLGEPIPIRIPEMFVRSSTFFTTRLRAPKEKPKIALLYEDNYKRVKLRIREIDFSPGLSGDGPNAELPDAQQKYDKNLEAGASHLIPVSAPAHGFIVLGETSILYYEASSEQVRRKALQAATIFVAWEQIDAQRYVLADEYGKLYLFMLELDAQNSVSGWKLDVIGETSKAEVLVYLGAGQVFVGSHSGDSQVIAIKPQAIDTLQTLSNIAPILDFTIMDMGNSSGEGQANEFSSGQARLVTGSGAFKDGSLRSVRSGVGLEDLGLIDQIENVTNLFSVNSSGSIEHVDTLVVSLIAETRIFHFSADGDVEELAGFKGLHLNCSTLFTGNVDSNRLVQVTESSVRLLDLQSGLISAEWQPPSSGPSAATITAVTSNSSTLVVSVSGLRLYTLSLSSSLHVISCHEAGFDSQIACINIARDPSSSLLFVGFWGSTRISVLSLSDLSTVHTASAAPVSSFGKASPTVPRSLLLARILQDQSPILFVALADGTVVTFSCDPSTGALVNPKSIVLGTQQADLRILPRADGLDNVLAIAEHASLIYGSEGRLTYSAVTAEDASVVAPFDAEAYPGAIAIAGSSGLKIAIVDEERSTHVQGLQVGETVRRIAHSPKLNVFGLGTISRVLDNGVELVQSAFKIADEVTFAVQATYALNDDELVESVMRCELDDGYGRKAERFVVGTAYIADDADEAIRGRIVVLEVTEDRQLKEICEQNVKGACRVLSMIDGRIVAALIKTVVIYELSYTTSSVPSLIKKASYRTSTAPISVTTHTPSEGEHFVAIGDLMKSVSVVKYNRGQRGQSDNLDEVARHFSTTWVTAVELIDAQDNSYLVSDAEGDLMVLRQDLKGVTIEDRKRLQVTSEMCISELVNRMQRINVPTPPTLPVVPRAFLATVEGSIHLFATIKSESQDLLMRLQGAMAEVVKSPGNVPFGQWRGFRSPVREETEPFRFVDGELIEMFLDLRPNLQVEVLEKSDVGEQRLEEIKNLVESLRRLR
ncbi:MAG: hypothetical protein Q9159_002378 [Coniocarpon cinnabarinum]